MSDKTLIYVLLGFILIQEIGRYLSVRQWVKVCDMTNRHWFDYCKKRIDNFSDK